MQRHLAAMAKVERGGPILAWRSLKALLHTWRKQDDEASKIVESICTSISRSIEFEKEQKRCSSCQNSPTESFANDGGHNRSVIDLFPGAWSRLQVKSISSAIGPSFKQLVSMYAVLEDVQKSMDTLLEGLMDAVVGGAASDGRSFSDSVVSAKGIRSLDRPLCTMDLLDWFEQVCEMYRVELLRKKLFISNLKQAALATTAENSSSAVQDDREWHDEQVLMEKASSWSTLTASDSQVFDRSRAYCSICIPSTLLCVDVTNR